jgi:Derlin-2/3
MEMLNQIPPFTRVWGIGILVASLLVAFHVVSAMDLVFYAPFVLRGQVWRLFTSAFFMGDLQINLIIQVFFSLMFIKNLEQQLYSRRLSAMIFIGILLLIIIQILSSLLTSLSICDSLLHAFAFIYSKLFTGANVNFLMIFTIPIQYYPFLQLLMPLLMGGSIIPGLIGIVAGHLVFYLLFVLPLLIQRPILRTPRALVRACGEEEGQQPQEQARYGGQGRRLMD